MLETNVVNIKMEENDAIVNKTADCEEIAYTILSHLIETRPIRKPMWKPYICNEAISYGKKRKHDIFLDMKKFYPESAVGDAVYTSCNIVLEKDYTVWINVTGLVKIFLNGKCLFSSFEEADATVANKKYISVPVDLKKDETNNLVIKYVFEEEIGGFWLNISPPFCASLWANFYLVMARVHFPLDGLTDEEGMWHQVIDRPDSYSEASCTAMFTTAMYRGVKNGWIDEKYMSCVKRGLKALLGKCVDSNGVLYNVCMGSSCSMDVNYYLRLGTIKDDNHGTGIILMLLADIINCGDKSILFNEG